LFNLDSEAENERKSTDAIRTIVTDQGSNFVRLFKQQENIEQDENIEIVSIDQVKNEIMQIYDEISEFKSPDNINSKEFEEESDTEIEEILKKEVGGKLSFVDDNENYDREYDNDTFHINFGRMTILNF
jgi:hypothetical protein